MSEPRITIGVPAEAADGERRVALVPDAVAKLVGRGLEVVVEPDAGAAALIPDDALPRGRRSFDRDPGAATSSSRSPRRPWRRSRGLREGAVLIGFLEPLGRAGPDAALAARGVRAFAMESIPRISRAQAMDVLSSQADMAGYKAVLIAAQLAPRFFPMLTTAAGTIPPAQGADGRRRRRRPAGARDRPAPGRAVDRLRRAPGGGEQVRSLGAEWLDLGIRPPARAATRAS